MVGVRCRVSERGRATPVREMDVIRVVFLLVAVTMVLVAVRLTKVDLLARE